jgi:chromosomal replication initiator protein
MFEPLIHASRVLAAEPLPYFYLSPRWAFAAVAVRRLWSEDVTDLLSGLGSDELPQAAINPVATGPIETPAQTGERPPPSRVTASIPGAPLTTLTGPGGSGKTALIQWTLQRLIANFDAVRFGWLSAEDWLAAEDTAKTLGATERFQFWCRSLHFVICEQLDQACRDPAAADLWATWLDRFLQRGIPVLITARRPPGQWATLSHRLFNRLQGGLMAAVPEWTAIDRRHAVELAVRRCQLRLTDEALQQLADWPPGSPRSLAEWMERLQRLPQRGRLLDLGDLRRAWEATRSTDRVPLAVIANLVAHEFGVTLGDLRSSSRQHTLRLPRQCAMYLAHTIGGWPMEQIGQYFGRRTHTSVSHSCRKLQELLPGSTTLRDQVRVLQLRMVDSSRERCG